MLQSFLHHKQKNGFTLYNLFMDTYVTREIKASFRFIDSLILIVFYSSLVDFYYLGPYLLNLVSSIKYVCNSKEVNTKIVNKNFMDINTMICDLIGFFNGFTRALCQDYNCYLGCDAIYNERCFLHLRKNNNDSILVMCREHSGSNQYSQIKSMGQIVPKNRNIIQVNNEENKIEVKNRNILNFMKLKKNMKKKQYFGINNFRYEKNNDYYNEYNNKDIDNETNYKMNMTTMTNMIDLPSESQIFDEKEKEKDNEEEQVLEVFDFINNVTKRNVQEENRSNNNIIEENDNNNQMFKYNNSNNIIINNIKDNNSYFDEEKNINSYQTKNSFNFRNDNYSQFSIDESEQNIQRNKTQNFNKMIANKNMELIKNINFEELNNDDKNKYDKNGNVKEEKNYNEYNNAFRNSLMYNFNQINNNYIDQENTQSYEQMNNYNFNQEINNNNNNQKYLRNNSVYMSVNSMNNISNSINNLNFSTINPYENNNNNNNIYYPIQNNSLNNNSSVNTYENNNNNYYPTQNNNINNNTSINVYESNNNNSYPTQNNNINNNNYPANNYNNNTQSLVPFQPPFNNNNNNQFQNNNYNNPNSKEFSQYDLSFLGGYERTNDLKEDYLKINPINPEIISELKEKIYYYYSLNNGCKLIKISCKGYIGINIKPPNIINNKIFYINFLSDKWKDNNYFINRDLNKKIEQVTQMIYKIQLQKQTNAVKLITYSLNQNISSRIRIIEPKINIINNQLIYIFNYNKESYKYVKRIEIIVEYKTYFNGWNMIKCDGEIINNNNMKINVAYNRNINEGKIIFPNNNNYNYNIFQYIKKISIMIQLKNAIISNMNAKINFSNSINQSQESLYCKKVSLLCFQYE